MDDLPLFHDWPLNVGGLLEDADAICFLIGDAIATWTRLDHVAPREAGVLIDLIRAGVQRLIETTATLDALATWNPQPGMVVLPNPATSRARTWERLDPSQWHATLGPLAHQVIARQPLLHEQAELLRHTAEHLAQQLGAAAQELDTIVRDRWDAPATRVAEHFLALFIRMEREERPGPLPLAPAAPWPAAWWTIAPNGPTSTQAILDHARQQQEALALALKQLTRSRSSRMRAATVAPMLALGVAGMDAIRRLRVVQHVLLFVLERTIYEWPIITPVPIAQGIPWAISGDRLPLLEEQRADLVTSPARAPCVAFLQHVADSLEETLTDVRDVEMMHLGNQVEGLRDVDDALARLLHGAAAPPRPAMPWLEEVEQARAMRRTLRTQAVQVREAILHGRVTRPKRRRMSYGDQPTPEGQACLDALQRAMQINRHVIFRAAVLHQVAALVQAGEEPTIESLHPRWVARAWWAWNERSAEMVFRDAIHEAYQPLDVLIFYGSGELRCGLASVYERMSSVLSDSIRDASRMEDALWTLNIDPRPWARAARTLYDAVDAANPHPTATVCCDCGKALESVMESYQCRRCERREWHEV